MEISPVRLCPFEMRGWMNIPSPTLTVDYGAFHPHACGGRGLPSRPALPAAYPNTITVTIKNRYGHIGPLFLSLPGNPWRSQPFCFPHYILRIL